MRLIKPILVALVLMSTARAWGDGAWAPNGVTVCASQYTKSNPVLIPAGAAGGIFTAWQDYRTDVNGINAHIYMQALDKDGAVLWAPASGVLMGGGVNYQFGPSFAPDDSNGAIIAWQDARPWGWAIVAQRVSALGAIQWAGSGVTAASISAAQYGARMCRDGAHGAIVAWYDARNPLMVLNIYAQRINAAGVPQWTPSGNTVSSIAFNQFSPAIAEDGQGGAIIVWSDYRVNPYINVWGQRMDANGNPLWAANGVRVGGSNNIDQGYQLAADGAGGAFLVWANARSGFYNIYAQHVNGSGSPVWTPTGVTVCASNAAQADPQLIPDGAGGLIVTWDDNRSGSPDIYAQRLNASGALLWPASGVPVCNFTNSQAGPQITPDGFGGALIVWEDQRNGSLISNLYAQRLNAAGASLWQTNGIPISLSPAGEYYVQTAASGGLVAVWAEGRTPNPNMVVYAQKLIRPFPVVTGIAPAQSPFGVTVSSATVSGFSFQDETGQVTYLKLTRTGQPDISAANLALQDSQHLTCDFALPASAGTLGIWAMVAYDSLGQTSTPSAAGFTVFQPSMTSLAWVPAPGSQVYTGTHDNWIGQINAAAAGYDVLQSLAVANLGNAEAATDISGVSLWYLAGGAVSGLPFNPATATRIGAFAPQPDKVTWTLTLNQRLNDGDALYLTADVPGDAALGRTMRCAVLAGQAHFQYGAPLPASGIFSLSQQTIGLGVTLQVAMASHAPANVTPGQASVPLGRIHVTNVSGGGLQVASVLLGLTDLAGAAQPLAAAFAALSLSSGGSALAAAAAPFGAAATFALGTPLNLTSQAQADLDVSGTIASAPAVSAFRLGLITGQCFNQGAYLAAPAAGTSFPLLTNPVNIRGADLTSVFSAYPNPFRPAKEPLHIPYYLAAAGTADFSVYTLGHQRVAAFSESRSQAGAYEAAWDGRNGAGQWVRSGIYVLKVETLPVGGTRETLTRKIAVVR